MKPELVYILPTPMLAVGDLLQEDDYSQLLDSVESVYKSHDGGDHMFQCDVWSTYQQYDISKDPAFKTINEAVFNLANEFAKSLSCKNTLAMFDGWLNRYKTGQHQELHHHGAFALSAVYFAEVPVGSSPLMFYNKNYPENEPTRDMDAMGLWSRYNSIDAKPNTLIIFPSSTQHMVPPSRNSEGLRTTLAWNFKEDDQFA